MRNWRLEFFIHSKKGGLDPVGGGGGTPGFQVTGMIEGFFGGVEIFYFGIFGGRKIWQVFCWLAG